MTPAELLPANTLQHDAVRRALWCHLVRRLEWLDCGCVIWTGLKNKDRYGRVAFGGSHPGKKKRREFYVHRLVYWIFCGPIRPGHEIHHACKCCNLRTCVSHITAIPEAENKVRVVTDGWLT